MTKVILVTEMVLEGLETPTSCKVVKINIYGTSIMQQAWLHCELEPTGSILLPVVPSRGSLYDFKPVSSVVISKRRRSTIGYGIFDESSIQIYFIQMQTTNGLFRGLPRCFASLVSHGFLCLRQADKLNLFLSSSVFMRSFNSYELFINPRLDSVIHNSGFSDSKYSLFIFV